MTWRGSLAIVLAFAVTTASLACGWSGGCWNAFAYQTPLDAGASACVLTLTNDDASVLVAIGDYEAGTSYTTACHPSQMGALLIVPCTTPALPDATLTCRRNCEYLFMSTYGAGSSDPIIALLGNPPADKPIQATMTCNGNPVAASKQASLQTCD